LHGLAEINSRLGGRPPEFLASAFGFLPDHVDLLPVNAQLFGAILVGLLLRWLQHTVAEGGKEHVLQIPDPQRPSANRLDLISRTTRQA
jgi:hypothetical protein